MLKGLVTQTTRSLGISPICIAQAEVLVFFELMMERKGEDDDDATRVTQEHQLMMIAEIVVANHQSGVNQASQVFLEHEFLSELSHRASLRYDLRWRCRRTEAAPVRAIKSQRSATARAWVTSWSIALVGRWLDGAAC